MLECKERGLYNNDIPHIVYAFGLAKVFLPRCRNNETTNVVLIAFAFMGGYETKGIFYFLGHLYCAMCDGKRDVKCLKNYLS